MSREIYIDGVRIGQELSFAELRITVGEDVRSAPIPNILVGRFLIPWRRREVEFRRVGGRNPETEVWVDGRKMPWSEVGPATGPKKKCAAHGTLTRRRCTVCEAALCLKGLAPDGLRCEECFERALREQGEERRATLLKLAAVALGVALLLVFASVSTDGSLSRALSYGASGAFAGLFAALLAAFRKPESSGSLALKSDLVFAVDDEGPQIVGRLCGACDKRIGWAGDGCFCARCRKVLHKGCEEEHRCRAPARGPDLAAMRGVTKKAKKNSKKKSKNS